jgi:hypothetical protein
VDSFHNKGPSEKERKEFDTTGVNSKQASKLLASNH